MKYRKLGNTDIEVSVVAMGCWAISGDATWGAQPADMITPTIEAALDTGINFFDTAPGYSNSEKLLGKALGSRRQEAIIASKIRGNMMREADATACCEKSLADLGVDTIDLMQLHWPSHEVPFTETYAALQKLRDQGKIRFIGVSNFGAIDMADVRDVFTFESNQLNYSMIARAIEYEIMPICERDNVSILAYSPLAQGMLTGKFKSASDVPAGRARTRHFDSAKQEGARHGESGCEEQTFAAIDQLREISEQLDHAMADIALAWCLHQPAVTSVLAGARSPQQIHDNARAADIHFDSETLAKLNAITDPVKQLLGSNPDMWVGKKDSRIR